MRDRVDHRLRLLSGCSIVEINERLAVDLAREDREVAADRLHVVGPVFDFLVHVSQRQRRAPLPQPCSANQASSLVSRASTMASSSNSSITSATKALTRSPRASFSGTPRAIK